MSFHQQRVKANASRLKLAFISSMQFRQLFYFSLPIKTYKNVLFNGNALKDYANHITEFKSHNQTISFSFHISNNLWIKSIW